MSADDQGSAAVSDVVADEGPRVITVAGQDPVVEVEPKPAAKVAVDLEEKADEGKARPKQGVQERIDELTRSRREAEREAEYWKARANPGAAAPAKAADPNKAPVKADFQTEEAYLEALTDHRVEQKLAQRDQKQEQVKAVTAKAESWQSKLASARTEIEGFDEAMNSNTAPVAAHVAELIMEHDHGAKVAHFLTQFPDTLEKLNELSPAKVAFEIGRIAAKFDTDPASSSKSAAEQVSKAPPPAARHVGAGRSTAPALGDLSMEDYIKARKAQGAGWAR